MSTRLSWEEIGERFRKLYVPAVCDALDSFGYWHQYMDHGIQPLHPEMVVAGPAFTILGGPDRTRDPSRRIGPKVIDQLVPHCVVVYHTMGDDRTGVWGELWSRGAMAKGCVGAVVDGGIRDTGLIRRIGFPIFHRFRCPADAVGRFNIVDFQCPITVGGVPVRPGDYIFGDYDGVVVIPKDLILDVLHEAERIVDKEGRVRGEISSDTSLMDLYSKYGKF